MTDPDQPIPFELTEKGWALGPEGWEELLPFLEEVFLAMDFPEDSAAP